MFENVIYSTFITCLLICLLSVTKVHALKYGEQADVDLIRWDQSNISVGVRSNDVLNCVKPSIYICEIPPNTVPPEVLKTCNYRNQNFHEQIYRWVAGRGCLLFTPNFLFVDGENTINLNTACLYGNFFAPCLEVAKDDGTCGCYPFDPGLPEVVNVVNGAIIPSARGRWERCFNAAAECCSEYMLQSDETEKCETTFDGWTCWHAAEVGTIANEICSEFAYSGQGPSCYHYSSKECYTNSTWEVQTNYTTCSITPRLLSRYRFHIGVLAFSIASCLPAVFIFFFYKRLRITRVALHRNLLIVIIIRNVLVIVSRSEIYIDELTNTDDTALSVHSVGCRLLAVAERIAGNAVFTCMLIEGIYLHRLIVAVFRQKINMKWLYAIGAVIAIAPVIVWTVLMMLYNDHSCWVVYTVDNIQWILDAPRVLILLINTALFADVLRVLLTKIRNSENLNQLNTAKATLFLMPIFGTQFLLTALRPSTTSCVAEQIYYFAAYAVEGVQGFLVALIYCYVNKEVRTLLKATYKKTENAVVSRSRDSARQMRATIDRRFTYSTGLSSNNDQCNLKDNVEAIKTSPQSAEVVQAINVRVDTALEPVCETLEIGFSNEGYSSDGSEDSKNKTQFEKGSHFVNNVHPTHDQNCNNTKIDVRNNLILSIPAEETIVTKL